MKFRFAIDRGGTFTDVYAQVITAQGSIQPVVRKLLSEDPARYSSAPAEGIRMILSEFLPEPISRGVPLPSEHIESIRMGTTVATNALLERNGEPFALAVSAGFQDVLDIQHQNRPNLFDLSVERPAGLAAATVAVEERVILKQHSGLHATVTAPPPGASDGCDTLDTDALAVCTSASGTVDMSALQAHLEQVLPPAGAELTGRTGEVLVIRTALDIGGTAAALQRQYDAGLRSLAVACMHSYAWSGHERAIAALARAIGFTHVTLSSVVMPAVRLVPRATTAAVDAYLTPAITAYIAGFVREFDARLMDNTRVLFMQSDGGLAAAGAFFGCNATLSGPAGGVVGCALSTQAVLANADAAGVLPREFSSKLRGSGYVPTAGFDMGGTSTDVSRWAGAYEHVFETAIAGVTIAAPQLDVNTVAAGGGSRLFYKRGMLVVGPQSAGAHPGPMCYRKHGHLAVTDANVMLGRVQPDAFPAIFGEHEDQPLDVEASKAGFQAIADAMAADGQERDLDEIAAGFIAVANEAMARPIRTITQMRGYDLATHVLTCFGGAGGQHACAIARALGMRGVVVHRYAGILSAYGMALADVVREEQAPLSTALATLEAGERPAVYDAGAAAAADTAAQLGHTAVQGLLAQGCSMDSIAVEVFVNLRFEGTDTTVMTLAAVPREEPAASNGAALDVAPTAAAVVQRLLDTQHGAAIVGQDFMAPDSDSLKSQLLAAIHAAPATFIERYKREYGFLLSGRQIELDDVRVRAVSRADAALTELLGSQQAAASTSAPGAELPEPAMVRPVYFDGGRVSTPFFHLTDGTAAREQQRAGSIAPGARVPGPAVLLQHTSTIVVEPGCVASVLCGGDVYISVPAPGAAAEGADTAAAKAAVTCDPVTLSIYSHRFMSVAEQMGRTLQRTAISVNIKLRLDYSCALFGPDGGLISNAPHVPVHLGSLSHAVTAQLALWTGPGKPGLQPGDVLVSNHPTKAGGCHLPDITVITPVFEHADQPAGADNAILFFVASRAHHADVGGVTPGSMPPNSKTLVQEGAAIEGFKLVKQGTFDERGIVELLEAPGLCGEPGCSGARNIRDVLSDLRAQVAANARGVSLVSAMLRQQGVAEVHAYMKFIRENAARCVQDTLRTFSEAQGLPAVGSVHAQDYMDDGTPIALTVRIDRDAGHAVFDFTGTGAQVLGNTNTPPAVSYSAVLYALRCLIDEDIPLNQGCLDPVDIILPAGTILSPSDTAAVVGGNVLTSQRLVDVVLTAFQAAACSCGCMNNVTFGPPGKDLSGHAWGYYETVAGGAGAGPTWDGTSGVHTHMTNTRITDPETLERRYPVILQAFHFRAGSGGVGARPGGQGVVRRLEFREPMIVSLLTERRALAPPGAFGGGAGARGLNLWLPGGDRAAAVNVGSKTTLELQGGDVLELNTPGGGAWGALPA